MTKYAVAPQPPNNLVGPALNISIASVAATWPAANRECFASFTVNRAVSVSTAWFRVATQSGNMSVGIRAADGTRLVTTGAFAVPAAAQTCSQALGAALLLLPNLLYYAAMSCDNTTAIFLGTGQVARPLVPGYTLYGAGAASHPLPPTQTIVEGAAGFMPFMAFN